jgi:gamma-glutamyltranspeptidase / glutathione hydrolase
MSLNRRFIPFGLAVLVALAACNRAQPPSATLAAPKSEAMVAAADPLAVEAGLEMLRAGGSATDAAIAVAMVLGLVEPESAGVGGGGFLIHYTGSSKAIDAYDGREWAPAGATPDMFMVDGKEMSFDDAQGQRPLHRHAFAGGDAEGRA